ncbi:MAG TPA: hypothetical protein VK808_13840 [Bacteroidia bacterium]|jgi:hypothetical protein|nr:hypothetical protein [Bacteroidia bacterium]
MKAVRKTVFFFGVMSAIVLFSSCSGGHATTSHKHAFKGEAKMF